MSAQTVDHKRESAGQQQLRGAAEELFDLQVEQFRHDEFYHREIARLTTHQRLNHMALHFAKYVGVFAQQPAAPSDERKFARAVVDGFIIGLSTANILNLRLFNTIDSQQTEFTSLSAFAKHIAHSQGLERLDATWLLKKMAIPVGEMAKACESIDHLEAFPFREEITKTLVEIVKCLLATMALMKIDPASAVRARLKDVKARYIFHGHL